MRLKKLTRNHTGGSAETQGKVEAGCKLFVSGALLKADVSCLISQINLLAKSHSKKLI
jgi:hypothetical protein